MSFALQKGPLAFYSSKQIAPFSLIPEEYAISEKVCKSVRFFAVIPEKGVRIGQSVTSMGPDWGLGDTLPEMPEKRAFLLCSEINAGAVW